VHTSPPGLQLPPTLAISAQSGHNSAVGHNCTTYVLCCRLIAVKCIDGINGEVVPWWFRPGSYLEAFLGSSPDGCFIKASSLRFLSASILAGTPCLKQGRNPQTTPETLKQRN
jgi:hypothetical protein